MNGAPLRMSDFKIETAGRLISPDFAQKLIKQIAAKLEKQNVAVIKNIKARTQSGKNVLGQQFPAYTPEYKKWKQNHGGTTSPINLTLTGKLLSSMGSEVRIKGNKVESRIFISADQQPKAEGVSKLRPFFGVTQEEQALFEDIINELDLTEANK